MGLVRFIVIGLCCSAAHAQPWTPEDAAQRVDAALSDVGDGDLAATLATLDALLDDAIAHAPLAASDTFTEIVAARRIVSMLQEAGENRTAAVWPLLQGRPELRTELAMLFRPGYDDAAGAFDVLARLRAAHGDSIAAHPALVSALCVVHDETFASGAMSSRTSKPDAVRVYDHLVGHQGQLVFDFDALPAELLVHLVDSIASEQELDWAFDRHAGDRLVGKRYHDVTYDTRFYKQGAGKKINAYEYTLENIRTYGGVCTDQAYYAATIGKAIGVPTAIVVGRAEEVGHCWVGFVRRDGRALAFDFDEGRYDDFEDVRGKVRDPQTGRTISDDDVALRADLAATPRDDRLGAVALLDVEMRIADGYKPPDDNARQPGADSRLDVLERAAALSPYNGEVWQRAAVIAEVGIMPQQRLRQWADSLHERFGSKLPTFTIEILSPMIASVEDTREQDRLWDWAYRQFRSQHDLACEILVAQARMWERAGQKAKAYDAYVDAANRYLNQTSTALVALSRAESMLTRGGKREHVLSLYENAWRRVRQPSRVSESFIRGTNWYRVGVRYAAQLKQAGRDNDAANVLKRIGATD